MTKIDQWYAGTNEPGFPPWDGTGVPFPTGADGFPVIPGAGGPVVVLTLAADSLNVPEGATVTLTVTADVEPSEPPTLHWHRVSDQVWETSPTTLTDPLTYVGTVVQPPYTNAAPIFIEARSGDSVSNSVTVQTSPVPVLTLTGAAEVVENTAPTLHLVADKAPRGGQELWWSQTDEASMVKVTGFFTLAGVNTEFDWAEGNPDEDYTGPPPGPVLYQARDSASTARSNVLSVVVTAPAADPNMGWTKAELIAFAEEHDPPIEVPSSGTKAEILAAILAYIQAHPEEN